MNGIKPARQVATRSRLAVKSRLLFAPTICSATCPLLTSRSVGMARMPYSAARDCCSSMLTLPILILPSYSSASSSSSGAIILHGPHHSAQKSTRTGVCDCRTCCAKLSCVRMTISGEAIMKNNLATLLLIYPTIKNPPHPAICADGGQCKDARGQRENFVEAADGRSGGNNWSGSLRGNRGGSAVRRRRDRGGGRP